MARKFTQQHYIAVADVLVAAYRHPANNGARTSTAHLGITRSYVDSRSAHHGINTVLAEFVRIFQSDSERFDSDKFHAYIEKRRQ